MSKSEIEKLKRKRATQRSNVTRFSNQINEAGDNTASDEIEHCLDRLQESLQCLTVLDDAIQDLLDDEEYNEDVIVCEDYTNTSKLAIRKAKRLITMKSASDISPNALSPAIPCTSKVELPTIRLEPFSGNIETWSRFWEQFQSSVDKNSSVSTINKHVFLRGYLEGEPKRLVDGIAVTADTYEQTKKILQSRYGDKNRIIQSHLYHLEHLEPPACDSPEALNETFIECHRHIQALTALGENVDVYGRILAPKLLRVFPDDLCRRWLLHAKRTNIEENNISRLIEFFNEEVECALNTHRMKQDAYHTDSYTPTASSFHVNTNQKRKNKRKLSPYCVFCESRGHWGQNCKQVTNCRDRTDKLKATNRCFLCLNKGHNVRQCPKREKASCSKCKKLHHYSICNKELSHQMSVGKIGVEMPHFTYLQTARVWITGPTGKGKLTRCILDTGSQSSFIHSSLIDLLQLEVTDSRNITVSAFESVSSSLKLRRQVSFKIMGCFTKATLIVSALESNNTYTPHPSVPQDISIQSSVGKIQLADPNEQSQELPIEILIGADHYWKIVKTEKAIRISQSLVLLPTLFGWIVSGNKHNAIVNQHLVHHISLSDSKKLNRHCLEPSDESLRQLWDLDTIGIKERQTRIQTDKDNAIFQAFLNSYRIENGRRVVSLPRKKDVIFANNLPIADRRFSALEKKLHADAEFSSMYKSKMLDYIVKEQVEPVPCHDSCTEVFYLPHHAVRKQKKDNTSYRIVFDASSHEKDSPSLNDALEMGPNLLPEILAVLLQFRMYEKALVCDGSQAFLQLTLHEHDRNLTRFLWYHVKPTSEGHYETTQNVMHYRFTRLPFGLTSSPFLLSATLQEVATLYSAKYPSASEVINKSTFMDDFTASREDDNQMINLYYELTALLRHIKLPLSKWATSSEALNTIWRTEGREVRLQTSVLGVDWNTTEDYLFMNPQSITESLAETIGTKRIVLRIISRFYDPLGLFAPVGVLAKILFQDIWLRGLAWDEILPSDLAQRWHLWASKFHSLSRAHIHRWIGLSNTQGENEIHVFCDASERAYGAVLYARSCIRATCSVRLICSKSRISPVKKVTLPRLELLAALIGSRLLDYFCRATDFDSTKATLWSDSTITLGWVRNDPNKWKTFVCNRITEILEYTTPSQWRHCPGTLNPADHISRGIQADSLCSLDTWWNGPHWLSKERTHWPRDTDICSTTLPEAKGARPQIFTITIPAPLLDVERYSSYWKLLHVTTWIFRFIEAVKQKSKFSHTLTPAELKCSRNYWIRKVQEQCFNEELVALLKEMSVPRTSVIARYNPFLSNGLIRLGGRLQCADLSTAEQHPVLLDGSHHFTQLLIMETHIRLHHLGVQIVLTELRSEFWILRARQTIKKILHTCLPCKIAHNSHFEEIEAPLPLDRVRPTHPFTVTGIDFAGPLYTKYGNQVKNSYILLFTCATTRAIHLELVSDMSTDRFLMAIQRFVGRRGFPHTVYSDNAPTFHAANKQLAQLFTVLQNSKVQHYFAHHAIVWKFIPPRAAWWGGWWERMIGSVKRCLRKVLGRSQVDEEGLNTILISIEAALNSRPLIQDTSTREVLTPAHFLSGEKLTIVPQGPGPPMKPDLIKEFRLKQKITNDFWHRWKKEYLLLLRSFHEVKGRSRGQQTPRLGDVVLLQEDTRPRHFWKRAVVEDIRRGRDEKIRVVILRLPDGTRISRPIQLVIPLEINQGGEDVADHGKD